MPTLEGTVGPASASQPGDFKSRDIRPLSLAAVANERTAWLCGRCGQPGHIAKTCTNQPTLKKKLASVVQPTPDEQKALSHLGRLPRLTIARRLELGERAARGDVLAQHLLVRYHVSIAQIEAQRWWPVVGYMHHEDLVSEGMIGLMDAASHFNPAFGKAFGTYAKLWVRARILNFAADNAGGAVRMGSCRAARAVFFKGSAAIKALVNRHGRMPDALEIANEINAIYARTLRESARARANHAREHPAITAAEVELVLAQMNHRNVRLDAPTVSAGSGTSGDGAPRHECFVDERALTEDDLAAADELRYQARSVEQVAYRHLDARERKILRSRYFVQNPMTLRAIGEEMGLSRERVRQIEERAIAKLRRVLGGVAHAT
jgi:RNA polymerase sigma-32 factor